MNKQNVFILIKISNIAFVIFIYFVIGYIIGGYLDNFFKYLFGTDYKSKSKYALLLEVIIQIMCIGIISYICRNLVPFIPFPLDGINGFDHMRVKELINGAFLPVFLIMFQYSMQDKLLYIKNMS